MTVSMLLDYDDKSKRLLKVKLNKLQNKLTELKLSVVCVDSTTEILARTLNEIKELEIKINFIKDLISEDYVITPELYNKYLYNKEDK